MKVTELTADDVGVRVIVSNPGCESFEGLVTDKAPAVLPYEVLEPYPYSLAVFDPMDQIIFGFLENDTITRVAP